MRALARKPAVHFLVFGGLLFLGRERILPSAAEEIVPVTIDAARIKEVRSGFERQRGRPPTSDEEAALVDELVNEELLYREALRRGLDQGDLVVFRRLVQKMEFLTDEELPVAELHRRALELGLARQDVIIRRRLVQQMKLRFESGAVRASEEEIADFYERHRDRFIEPERLRLTHVYLNRQERGERIDDDARRLLAELRAGDVPAEDAPFKGDGFLLGHHLARTGAELERNLGADFAAGVLELPVGTWGGIVESPYGLHIIRVHEKTPARPAALESVRRKVLQGIVDEKRQERFGREIQRLRMLYPIELQGV